MLGCKKFSQLLIVLMLLIFLILPIFPTLADGIMIEPDPEETVWDQITGQFIESQEVPVGRMVGENNQEAFISWDEKTGTEKMLIIVDRARSTRRNQTIDNPIFWIVPIKSECQAITPYHYDRFSSKLDVIKLEDEAKNRLKKTKDIILGMQIWPLLSKLTKKEKALQKSNGIGSPMADTMLWGGYEGEIKEVQVYTQIESFGVKTEVLSAQSANALEEYLRNNGIKLSNEIGDIIDSYINADYCFAVSKVTKPEEKGKLGIMLEFKPEKPFYPLYITSAYGNKKIGVSITTDFVSKVMMGKSELKTEEFYLKSDFTYGKDDENFFKKRDILTQVKMSESANKFVSDVYFEKNLPITLAANIKLGLWLVMLIAVIIISLALGFAFFRAHWLKVGILNSLLGVVGLVIGLLLPFYYNRKSLKQTIEEIKSFRERSEGKNDLDSVFIWNRIILALPILFLFLIPIMIFGGYEVQRFIEDVMEEFLQEGEFAAIFFIIAVPITFITSLISFLIKKIIQAHKVDINTRELFIDIAMFVVNLFEAVVLFSVLIVFLAMGPKGWAVGLVTVMIILGFVIFSKKNPRIAREILVITPFVYIILAFLNVIAALIAVLAIYPYLINYYYANNIQAVAEYLKKKDEAKNNGETQEADRVPIGQYLPRLILFSVMFVILYMGLDKIISFWL